MPNQTMNEPKMLKTADKKKAIRPLRLPILYGFLAAALLTIVVLLVVFPNLAGNPGYLALMVITTLFSFGSLGLTFSGIRARLPLAAKWAVSVALWGFVALDVIFLVLPNFINGPTANEADPFAASARPVAPATITPTAKTTEVAIVNTTEAATAKPTEVTTPKPTEAATATPTQAVTPKPTEPATVKTTEPATARATEPATVKSTEITTPKTTAPVTAKTTEAATPKTTEPTTKSPVSLTGIFNNAGAEPVAGKAILGKRADGKTVLRFENLNSAPGPDLVVYLSKSASPKTDAQVKNGLEIGKLKATKGDQNYELSGTLDLSQYKSIVVYCKSFSVVFGFANLS